MHLRCITHEQTQHHRDMSILSCATPRQAATPCAHVKPAMKDKQAGGHLHNELLAEQGACDTSIPDVLQVLKAALEVLAVCQHAQAGCTPFLICLGNLLQQQARLWDMRGCTAAGPDADMCIEAHAQRLHSGCNPFLTHLYNLPQQQSRLQNTSSMHSSRPGG